MDEQSFLKNRVALDKVLEELEQVLSDACHDLDRDTADAFLGTAVSEVGRIFEDYGITGWDREEEEE